MGPDQGIAWRDDAAYVCLQAVGAPMVITDANDRIADLTHPARTLLTKFELPHEPGQSLPEPLAAELRSALLGEAIIWRPRGEDGPVLGSTRYRLGDRHHLLLVREITKQQRAFAQRLHQQRLVETGKLVATIAHELRTPLGSIVYNADVLGSRDLGASQGLVSDIQLAAATLSQTIAGLLAYVRLGPPVSTTMSLRDLFDRVSSLLRPVFRAGEHELEIALHDADVRVSGNPLVLDQIFVNLLVNALEASTRPAKVSIRTAPRSATDVTITVVDDGPGIPAERRESVFQAFVSSKANGTGLGLTLAREAAISLGGHLGLEPSEGGCRFAVVLPIVREATA